MMSVVTTFTGHADFFVAVSSPVCALTHPPVLSDCTYPGLFVVTFPYTHISSGIQIFVFPAAFIAL